MIGLPVSRICRGFVTTWSLSVVREAIPNSRSTTMQHRQQRHKYTNCSDGRGPCISQCSDNFCINLPRDIRMQLTIEYLQTRSILPSPFLISTTTNRVRLALLGSVVPLYSGSSSPAAIGKSAGPLFRGGTPKTVQSRSN